MSRWISVARGFSFSLLMSRLFRLAVARGSIAYSAVTQPLPLSRRKGGTFSSTVALQMTFVSPNSIKTEPSAYFVKFFVIRMGRSWLFSLPSYLLTLVPPLFSKKSLFRGIFIRKQGKLRFFSRISAFLFLRRMDLICFLLKTAVLIPLKKSRKRKSRFS